MLAPGPWMQAMVWMQWGTLGPCCPPHHTQSSVGNGATSHVPWGRIGSAQGVVAAPVVPLGAGCSVLWGWECSSSIPVPVLPLGCGRSCPRGLASLLGCHQSPSHTLQPGKSPAATSPFHLPPRQAAPGKGAMGWGPTAHAETCLARAMSTHPLPHCASHSAQHHSLWLHCHCLIPQDPWPPSRLQQPPALASPLGWLGSMALGVGALQGWNPASCSPLPPQGWDLCAHESDSEPKGNQEHCHRSESAPSLMWGRGRCPGSCAKDWHPQSLRGDKPMPAEHWGGISSPLHTG